VRTILTAVTATIILVGALGTGVRAADAPATPFSVKDIFVPENSAQIYSDCAGAHEAADFIYKHAETMSADEAVGAQQLFVNCGNETHARYDANVTRYLLLAIAGATYIEAKETTGDRHAGAVKRGMVALDRAIPRQASSALRGPAVSLPVNVPMPTRMTTSPSDVQDKINSSNATAQHLTMNGAHTTWRFELLAGSLRDAYDALAHAEAAAPKAAAVP
jgi:hypothetical protein